jgi:cytochrome c-type biogenesis protein CcmH
MTAFLAWAGLLAVCSFLLLVRPAWRRGGQREGEAAADPPPSRRLMAGLAGLLLAVAAGGYAWIGSPDALALRPGVPTTPTEQVAALLQQLQARVKQQPGDATAWGDLARANVAVGRHPEGLAAFRQALALRPNDADLLTDYADVLAVANGRRFAGEPERLVERALRADPDHLKALTLAGMGAFKRQDHAAALAYWEKAVRLARPGDPLAGQLRGVMAQARQATASTRVTASAPVR